MRYLGAAQTCEEMRTSLKLNEFLATPAGGRSSKHQKEHAAHAASLREQLKECEAEKVQEQVQYQQTVTRIVNPPVDPSWRRWALWVGLGVSVIALGTWLYLRKRK